MRINWSLVKGLFLLGLVLFLYAFSSFKNNNRPVSSLYVEFTGEDNVFITSEMVDKLLIQSQEKLYFLPKEDIDLKEMEFLLESNDMIKSAQVPSLGFILVTYFILMKTVLECHCLLIIAHVFHWCMEFWIKKI